MSESPVKSVIPEEGWHVLHLYYRIEYGQWDLLGAEEREAARRHLGALIDEARSIQSTQLLTFSVVTPKADLGFMLLTPDLQVANDIEKRLTLSLGPDVLSPVFSYLSMTERSEYFTSEEDYTRTLETEEKLVPGTEEFEAKLGEFRERAEKYLKHRLYPKLPDWPVVCFYPMSKRRGDKHNWYSLGFAERRQLMSGHARTGRQWHGKILQLITGSTGLDDMEWGVTLFAHDSNHIKGIVYEMRFDAVSADFAEFGDFFIGLQLPMVDIFRRLQL